MNLPNALSLLRLFMVPLFVAVFFSDHAHAYYLAAAIFLLAGLTDYVDGKLARKYHMVTVLGKLLDPLADKLLVMAALMSLAIRGFLPGWVVALYFVKELAQGALGLLLYCKIKDVPPSNIIGKTAATIFYISIAAILAFGGMHQTLKLGVVIFAMLLLFVAMATYVIRGVNMLKAYESDKSKEIKR